jgi:hypothetical protein
MTVNHAGLRCGKKVRQVSADHQQGLWPTPDGVENLRNLAWGGLTDHQGEHGELAKHSLQKRQLHLERVLLGVCPCIVGHEGEGSGLAGQHPIDGNVAQRGSQGIDAWQTQPVERCVMRRPQQDHARWQGATLAQQVVGTGRDAARIDVPSMRHHQRLRSNPSNDGYRGKQRLHGLLQLVGPLWVERPGDRRQPYEFPRRAHAHLLATCQSKAAMRARKGPLG